METHLVIRVLPLAPVLTAVIGEIGVAKVVKRDKYELESINIFNIDIYSTYKNKYRETLIDGDTVQWLLSDITRYKYLMELFNYNQPRTTIKKALNKIYDLVDNTEQTDIYCWSRRPAFDIAMLNWCYHNLTDNFSPWSPKREFDLQTLLYLFPEIEVEEEERTHDVCYAEATILTKFLNKEV